MRRATREQARSKAGLRIAGARNCRRYGVMVHCAQPRTKTKILYMGDLMVHKVIMRGRAGHERRFGEP